MNNNVVNSANNLNNSSNNSSILVERTQPQQTQTLIHAQETSQTPSAIENSSITNIPLKNDNSKKNKIPFITILLLLVIAGLCFYIYYNYRFHEKEIARLKYECTPVSTLGETKELDLNSTIVQDLYSKVKTNIREDLANFELNDEMKLYLAYRQIPANKIYDSNCNYFSDTKMPPYTCKETAEFTPKAFKQEELMLESKKLFGESTQIPYDDIQLGLTCLGGYQYIADRGEFVSGNCIQQTTTTFKVDKELIRATSTESTISLYEKVKYYGTEGKNPPEKLISGTYKYTFRLDVNYNYIYISKELEM